MNANTARPTRTAARRPAARRPHAGRGPLEWGPAKHDPAHPYASAASGDDPRDALGARPEDN